jgi:hypothetical protein
MRLVAKGGGRAQEPSGGAHEMVELFKVYRSDFEKIKSKKLQKNRSGAVSGQIGGT